MKSAEKKRGVTSDDIERLAEKLSWPSEAHQNRPNLGPVAAVLTGNNLMAS